MPGNKNISIALCDKDPVSSGFTKTILNRANFTNITAYKRPVDFINDLRDKQSTLKLAIIDTCFNCKDQSGLKLVEYIKNVFPDTIVICTNSVPHSKYDYDNKLRRNAAFDALSSGCDSWLDKENDTYISNLIGVVDHWTQYTIEKAELAELYDNILNSSKKNAISING